MEATVEIGQRLDGLAGTGGRQCQTQAQRRDDALAATQLFVVSKATHPRRVSDGSQEKSTIKSST
jgi:hypothetical protein